MLKQPLSTNLKSTESSARNSSKDLYRLWSLAATKPLLLTSALLALAMGAAVNLSLPVVIKHFVDTGGVWQSFTVAFRAIAVIILIFAVQAGFFYLRSFLFSILGQRATAEIRKQLFNSILHKSIEFFDRSRVGDLTSRLIADTSLLQEAISLRLSVVIRYSVQVVVGAILMLFISWRLSIAILAVVPILVAISRHFGSKLKFASRELQAEVGKASDLGEEAFSGIRAVRAFTAETIENEKFQKHAAEFLKIGARRAKIAAFFSSFVSFLLNSVLAVIILAGIISVKDGTITTGELTAFLLYGVMVGTSFALLAGAYSELLQALGGISRVFEILDSPSRNDETGTRLKAPILGNITFRNVSFTYPSRPDEYVLKNINIDLKPEKTTALIGYSGAGKSSIVNLALKFYEPTSGEILFDGVSLSSIDSTELRKAIGLVPQDLLLFNTSLIENIRYGTPNASNEDVRRVCRDVGLLSFIDELPNGLFTEVGTRGVQLSGGQRQRVALARALLKDATVLILDEATSALDADSERQFQETLKRVSRGKTTLIISHRLASVQNADWIYVLEEGEIVSQGTHSSLLAENGVYAHLVKLQSLKQA